MFFGPSRFLKAGQMPHPWAGPCPEARRGFCLPEMFPNEKPARPTKDFRIRKPCRVEGSVYFRNQSGEDGAEIQAQLRLLARGNNRPGSEAIARGGPLVIPAACHRKRLFCSNRNRGR